MFKILNIILLTIGMTYAQDLDLLFSDGNKSYNNNQFDDAVHLYEDILSQGFYSADLYYNLGNAYYRLEDFGNARSSSSTARSYVFATALIEGRIIG